MTPSDDHRTRATYRGTTGPGKVGCAPLALLGASQPADDRDTTFRAVAGGGNMRSGTVLLVEAYAVIWLVVLVFVGLSLRRQRRMNARIARLEQQLTNVRGPAALPPAEPAPETDDDS